MILQASDRKQVIYNRLALNSEGSCSVNYFSFYLAVLGLAKYIIKIGRPILRRLLFVFVR